MKRLYKTPETIVVKVNSVNFVCNSPAFNTGTATQSEGGRSAINGEL